LIFPACLGGRILVIPRRADRCEGREPVLDDNKATFLCHLTSPRCIIIPPVSLSPEKHRCRLQPESGSSSGSERVGKNFPPSSGLSGDKSSPRGSQPRHLILFTNNLNNLRLLVESISLRARTLLQRFSIVKTFYLPFGYCLPPKARLKADKLK
jgi:hypothetical protein